MPLAIDPLLLVTLVVGGVSGVVLGTVALGWNREATLDAEAVARAFRGADAHLRPGEVVLADDARSALVDLGSGVGLVLVHGDRIVARTLDGALRRVTESGTDLRLSFADLGLPSVSVVLQDTEQRSRWRERLQALVEAP